MLNPSGKDGVDLFGDCSGHRTSQQQVTLTAAGNVETFLARMAFQSSIQVATGEGEVVEHRWHISYLSDAPFDLEPPALK